MIKTKKQATKESVTEKKSWLRSYENKDSNWHGGGIYVIKKNGYVKIGKAVDFKTRLRSYIDGPGESIEVIALIPVPDTLTNRKAEAAVHKKFKSLHVRGEWFKDSVSLRTALESWPPLEVIVGEAGTVGEGGASCCIIEGLIDYDRWSSGIVFCCTTD